jgi:tubulin-specific chaperone E
VNLQNATAPTPSAYTVIELEVHQYPTPTSPRQDLCLSPASPIALRVLPSMSLRIFRLKVLKCLKSSRQHSSNFILRDLWLKMGDDTFAKLDHDSDEKDLDWLGFENGSEVLYDVQ